ADELLDKIDDLDWPQTTKQMQKHWIGKSYGTEIDFSVDGETWPVFTTRPDTVYGVTFAVISPHNRHINSLVTESQKGEVKEFLKKLKSVSEKDMVELEKEGAFTGSYAINPVNGENVPIYIGNFVVDNYGSGMVMGVPAHDKRDFYFAKKYGIKIKIVINPVEFELTQKNLTEPYVGEGTLVNSGKFNELSTEKAREAITDYLKENGLGKKSVQFRLKDWGISRQRYWGTPIPIIHCGKCGAVAVPEKDLPVKLPKEVKFGEGNPLLINEIWGNVKCPKCGIPAKRETDTMDTFVNSSWYFLRYCDPKNKKKIFDGKKAAYWCPVDVYIGGAEHACMHLIYSRFYIKFLRDLGLINFDEPAKRLFHQGMLHAEGGERMSKSKNNVVLPESVSNIYGIDTARFFLSSLASPDKDIDWDEKGIEGSLRFIKKIYNYFLDSKVGVNSKELDIRFNESVKKISENIEGFGYRKATIEIREIFDLISKEKKVKKKILEGFLKLFSPFCPHITEELWEKMGNKKLISTSKWPGFEDLGTGKKFYEDVNDKVIKNISEIINKLEGKGKKISKAYFYFLPFEFEKIDKSKFKKELGKEIFIYSVKDPKKYDPEGRSKKARPGMPGMWFE
ncbi:MAG: class I tRNA ligase family protein, partial [Nanoarchaeota archaeon]|nr:class I tRNA ligase family protein [Nanoarchaeota archaeon]